MSSLRPDVETTAGLFNHCPHGAQTESRAVLFGGEKRLEEPRLHFTGHSFAAVGDLDHETLFIPEA